MCPLCSHTESMALCPGPPSTAMAPFGPWIPEAVQGSEAEDAGMAPPWATASCRWVCHERGQAQSGAPLGAQSLSHGTGSMEQDPSPRQARPSCLPLYLRYSTAAGPRSVERPGSPSALRPWLCRQLGGRQLGRRPGRDSAWIPEPGFVCLRLEGDATGLTTLSQPCSFLTWPKREQSGRTQTEQARS